ncbi:MAG: mechanosensitive ion channel domain-containing protein [Cyanobacteria bacterium P01_H01_bin.15]
MSLNEFFRSLFCGSFLGWGPSRISSLRSRVVNVYRARPCVIAACLLVLSLLLSVSAPARVSAQETSDQIYLAQTTGVAVDATTREQKETESSALREEAPIMVDGRVLFSVGSIEGFSAVVRADNVNSKIERVLKSTSPEEPIEVATQQEGEFTTIRLNNQHLLTVTEGDFITGVGVAAHAQQWSQILQRAINRAQAERTPAYQRRALLICAGFLVGSMVITFMLRWLRRRLYRRIARGESKRGQWIFSSMLWQPVLLMLQWLVWLVTFIHFAGLFPSTRYWRYRLWVFLQEVLTEPLFRLGETGYSLLAILQIVILVFALWCGVRIFTVLLRSQFLNAIGADREIQDVITLFLQILMTGIGVIVILQGLGFDVSSIAILASVLGVGIGFGLQNLFNNFISGLLLLFERQIRAGDFVKVGDLTGTVEHIGARSTEIRTMDYITIIVPNSELMQTKVVNWSHGHPVSRLHIPFGVAYGTDLRLMRQVALEAVSVHPDILRYPQPQVWFNGFGDSALDFELLIWIQEPRYQLQLRSDVYYLLEANFRHAHIEIPFPQQDLHLRSPNLEETFIRWQENGSNISEARLIQPDPATQIPAAAQPESNRQKLLLELLDCSIFVRQKNQLSDGEINNLVEQIQGSRGVSIKDRRYGLRMYPNCFVGSEAVEWLMDNQKATREEAIRIGQILVERGIIYHVTHEHTFQDQYLFYQFYQDSLKSRTP